MAIVLPSKSGYLPGTTNARTSAIETMRLTNVKQNMLNNMSGGTIRLPPFHDSIPYKPNGTNPADVMVTNAIQTSKGAELAKYDSAVKSGGRKRRKTIRRKRRKHNNTRRR